MKKIDFEIHKLQKFSFRIFILLINSANFVPEGLKLHNPPDNNKYLPSQVGNAKCSAAHWVHLSPTMLGLQEHFPLPSSQEVSTDPSSLH